MSTASASRRLVNNILNLQMWKLRCHNLAQATVRSKESNRAKTVNLYISIQQTKCTHENTIRFDNAEFSSFSCFSCGAAFQSRMNFMHGVKELHLSRSELGDVYVKTRLLGNCSPHDSSFIEV